MPRRVFASSRLCHLAACACLALVSAGAAPPDRTIPAEPPDVFTPVVARVLSPGTAAVRGTDGRLHLVYELQLVNTRGLPATPTAVHVVELASDRVLASFSGEALLARLWSPATGPGDSPVIPPDETRSLLIDLTVEAGEALTTALAHRLEVTGAASPAATAPTAQVYTAAPLELASEVPVLGPPLRGSGWVAANGCCEPAGAHRSAGLPVNGELHYAQRFAIDWMRMDEAGRFVTGDPADVRGYTSYGAEVLAVADGLVVSALDTLPDQPPGQLPDPATITVENVNGNHVVIDLGNGLFAFFAHLAPGSVRVRAGDRVTRGQVLGLLGNSGNSSAPHLHFHVMDGASVLGSNGRPYTIDRFTLAGQVNVARFAAAPTLEGRWNDGLLPSPEPRAGEFPLDLDVVDFPGRAPRPNQ